MSGKMLRPLWDPWSGRCLRDSPGRSNWEMTDHTDLRIKIMIRQKRKLKSSVFELSLKTVGRDKVKGEMRRAGTQSWE